ncbi:MAG: type II toxin-antitoxin system Phd/YefM family antitoxin [Candidatus Binatia bacterium]
MAHVVNVHAAKTHLSRLIDRAAGGEEIIIARAGRPVARLAPLKTAPVRRKPGLLRGRIWIADDFDAPLPKELLDAFNGGSLEPRRRRR